MVLKNEYNQIDFKLLCTGNDNLDNIFLKKFLHVVKCRNLDTASPENALYEDVNRKPLEIP